MNAEGVVFILMLSCRVIMGLSLHVGFLTPLSFIPGTDKSLRPKRTKLERKRPFIGLQKRIA